jgi:hypothetical protein
MWLESAVIALVVLQAMSMGLLWQQRRRFKRRVSRKSHETGSVPALMIVNALNAIDHRLSLLEARKPQTETPRRSLDVSVSPISMARSASLHSSVSHYELAQQLAREGSDVDELIERCGLSRNEAELVLRLYARRA